MFSKILVANRGEIAVRIIRACREMGIETVSVYSLPDKESLHVLMADEAYCIGPGRVKDSYLNMGAILAIAQKTGCHAIHPGYGLLAENAAFAQACREEGLVFIGPRPETITRMGDKEEARRVMKEAKVPVVPGLEDVQDLEAAKAFAQKVGYPLLIKAAAGGGGKGIRKVNEVGDWESQWQMARQEAASSFMDETLYLEKFLQHVKHVEVQVLCDTLGHCLILGERDCSVQRKNQKLLEESPCTLLCEHERAALYAHSKKAVERIGYVGAGTLEFLMDEERNFYFMEMNTRLQVEHPVTEMVTDVDLLQWQIRIAAGASIEKLNVTARGHAIECRILAENPQEGYRPSFGRIEFLHSPGGPNVRFDTFIYSGCTISPFYDSMVGKLIVWSSTREESIRKMRAALGELIIEGIDTTTAFHLNLLNHEKFLEGTFTTGDLET
ncbi:Biotin carboxylase of acetyl-CoA carboxylase [Clostridiaceae bacterium JG1575]|nr:Biotin carboxylase of acetyl-CoA carboxylase [Clostridiaceae bacterium JG1575]